MHTNVQNPQAIFNMPQQLLVPLFQRQYVWSEELQWSPLWLDVVRVTERLMTHDPHARHFLGAVVLQQEANATGTLMTRTVIDGQQRLTTLQLLFNAIRNEMLRLDMDALAKRIGDLVENPEYQRRSPEDRFKLWPTNRDRDAFAEVMSSSAPDHATLTHSTERIVQAHAYFSTEVRQWLEADSGMMETRASYLVDAVATCLQIVVIDLQADEDAQEIFETLNARGTPLTAADLIKNLVFQRLNANPEIAEKVYHQYWEQFETKFWEEEVSSGRVLWSRSSLFLNQWLTSQTQQDVPSREVFASFKRYLDDVHQPIEQVLQHIKDCADIYEAMIRGSQDHHKPLTVLERFIYRTSAMQSEIIRPIVIWLTDPVLASVPSDQLVLSLNALESWLVRRMLVRENTAGQNRFVVELLRELAQVNRDEVGMRILEVLKEQTADASYWPDDDLVRRSLEHLAAYKRLSRGRLRMILEALEDERRGFSLVGVNAKGEQPVVRDECTVEHIMPQSWGQHWPLNTGVTGLDRDALIHTLGNLTLVSKSLNPSLSNDAWLGEKKKRAELKKHSSIKLTAEVTEHEVWDESLIQARTEELIESVLRVWPIPGGHSNDGRGGLAQPSDATIGDLLRAGFVTPGTVLVTSHTDFGALRAVVTPNGSLEVDGRLFETPSGAAVGATKRRALNGWSFWRVGDQTGPRLMELRDKLRAGDGGNDSQTA